MTGEQKPKFTDLTREQLYERVWTKAMMHCAADLGISGNGLAKICDRAKVPYPPRGYWAKLQAGKAPPKTPLPKPKADTPLQVRVWPTQPKSERPVDPVDAQLATTTEVPPEVKVNERLSQPHRIIREWMDDEERDRKRNRNSPWTRDLIKPETELDRLQRRVQDALYKALEARGHKLETENQYSRTAIASVNGQKVSFWVYEAVRQHRRELTPKEIKDRGYGGKYVQIREPTGLLRAGAKGGYGHAATWPKKDGLLEEQLGQVVLGIEAIAKAAAASDEARLKREAEWRREQQEREHRAYLRRQDDNRWEAVRSMASDWKETERLRAFILAVEAAAEPDDQGVKDWVSWARTRLNAFNPLHRGAKGVADLTEKVDGYSRSG